MGSGGGYAGSLVEWLKQAKLAWWAGKRLPGRWHPLLPPFPPALSVARVLQAEEHAFVAQPPPSGLMDHEILLGGSRPTGAGAGPFPTLPLGAGGGWIWAAAVLLAARLGRVTAQEARLDVRKLQVGRLAGGWTRRVVMQHTFRRHRQFSKQTGRWAGGRASEHACLQAGRLAGRQVGQRAGQSINLVGMGMSQLLLYMLRPPTLMLTLHHFSCLQFERERSRELSKELRVARERWRATEEERLAAEDARR